MTNRTILDTAKGRLQAATYNPKRLIFLHAGIAALATLFGSLTTYFITNSMDNAVGLSGLDTRVTLSFFRTVLLLVTTVALPFWNLGYTRAAVLYADGHTPTPTDLLTGFRRFLPALRLLLIQLLAVFAVLFFTVQAATTLFMLSPFGLGFMQQAEKLLTPDVMMSQAVLNEELMNQLLPSLIPVYILWAVLALAALIFLFYRFRFAEYALMDRAPGAIAAFKTSLQQTRGRRLQLFKLDLHYWWYSALTLLTVAVSYLDVLLPRLGVAVDKDVAFWVFFLLGQLCNLALHVFCTPKVQTSYALFAKGSFQR